METLTLKKSIRTEMKKIRGDYDQSDYRISCFTIMKNCLGLPEISQAKKIHIYVSALNNEVDTLGIIIKLLEDNKTIAVPKIVPGKKLLWNIKIDSIDELTISKFGIPEPEFSEEKIIPPESLDLIIAPLLAFDRSGGRLGFGGGYYDSLFKSCHCPKIGLAHSFQEIDKVPEEIHDQKLDIIITEKQIIRICYAGKQGNLIV